MYRTLLVSVCAAIACIALILAVGCSSSDDAPTQPDPCSIEMVRPELNDGYIVPAMNADDDLVTIQWNAAGGGQARIALLKGGVVQLAALSGSLVKGIILLSAYSLGFALPLMLCALAVERSMRLLDKIKPWLGTIEKGTGAVLLAVGVLMAGGWFSRFATYPLSYFSGWVKLFGRLGL